MLNRTYEADNSMCGCEEAYGRYSKYYSNVCVQDSNYSSYKYSSCQG